MQAGRRVLSKLASTTSQLNARNFLKLRRQVEIISGLPEDATISLYRCGPMVDLCRGPHLPHSGLLKATAVQAMSRSFWKGDVTREGLQVCVCFGSQNQL